MVSPASPPTHARRMSVAFRRNAVEAFRETWRNAVEAFRETGFIGASSYLQSACAAKKFGKACCAMCNVQCVGYDTAPMVQSSFRTWRPAVARAMAAKYLSAVAALTAGVAAVVTLNAQSSGGKWWPGYSGGADNSRYFASRQINKGNVSRLQVAWTYPFGDTSFNPIAIRGAIYGRGRNGSLVAVRSEERRVGKECRYRWPTDYVK